MEPGKQPPYRVFSAFSGVDQSMELDTGASKTVISEEVYKTLCKYDSRLKFKRSCTKLRTYTGELIPSTVDCELQR